MSHGSDDKTKKRRTGAMTHGFQQQDTGLGYAFPKSAATPQHGQKPAEKPLPVREPRACKPRPGH
jgi:hypothetical protein